MLDYLYYKLYQAMLRSSTKDIAEYTAAIAMGGLFGVNIVIVSAFLSKLDISSFLYKDSATGGICTALIMVMLGVLYIRKKRYERVNEKYRDEPNAQRIKGNAIVALYVGISFIAIFAVAFFKPGYLPK